MSDGGAAVREPRGALYTLAAAIGSNFVIAILFVLALFAVILVYGGTIKWKEGPILISCGITLGLLALRTAWALPSVLRRAPGAGLPGPLTVGDLTLDPARRVALVAGREAALTGREFALLVALARAPGRVLSREDLVARAFGDAFDGFDRTVDAHVAHLRRKIEDDPASPTRVVTVFGAGYRLDVRAR